jgi:hypothetical protein
MQKNNVRDVAIAHVCIRDGSGGWSTTFVSKFKSVRLADCNAHVVPAREPRKYRDLRRSDAVICTRDVHGAALAHD